MPWTEKISGAQDFSEEKILCILFYMPPFLCRILQVDLIPNVAPTAVNTFIAPSLHCSYKSDLGLAKSHFPTVSVVVDCDRKEELK